MAEQHAPPFFLQRPRGMSDSEAVKLVEDVLRESLYAADEPYDEVVDEVVAGEGDLVRVRLRAPAPDFDVVVSGDYDRAGLAAQIERRLREARGELPAIDPQ